MLSTANPIVDDIHQKVEAATLRAFTAMSKDENPIIIRLHTISTTRQILTMAVDRPSKTAQITFEPRAVDELKEPSITKQLYAAARRVNSAAFLGMSTALTLRPRNMPTSETCNRNGTTVRTRPQQRTRILPGP